LFKVNNLLKFKQILKVLNIAKKEILPSSSMEIPKYLPKKLSD
jgi:hypothetical protein